MLIKIMFREFKSLYNLNWIYIFILLIIFWIGEINLYSAAGGSLDPWASNQLIRFLFFLPLFFFDILVLTELLLGLTWSVRLRASGPRDVARGCS